LYNSKKLVGWKAGEGGPAGRSTEPKKSKPKMLFPITFSPLPCNFISNASAHTATPNQGFAI
jgi:hypothetical protein